MPARFVNAVGCNGTPCWKRNGMQTTELVVSPCRRAQPRWYYIASRSHHVIPAEYVFCDEAKPSNWWFACHFSTTMDSSVSTLADLTCTWMVQDRVCVDTGNFIVLHKRRALKYIGYELCVGIQDVLNGISNLQAMDEQCRSKAKRRRRRQLICKRKKRRIDMMLMYGK